MMTDGWRVECRARLGLAHLVVALLYAGAAHAQVADRTIEEIRVETQARAERGAYPLIGLDRKDVADALATIKTRDIRPKTGC